MKKTIWITVSILLLLGALCACGNKNTAEEYPKHTQPQTEASSKTAEAFEGNVFEEEPSTLGPTQTTEATNAQGQQEPTTQPTTIGSTPTTTTVPSTESATKPTTEPTTNPTTTPTTKPTSAPTTKPTTAPTTEPTTKPTTAPTTKPTTKPTSKPTTESTAKPTTEPTTKPTTAPTTKPTTEPTTKPTTEPTTKPTQAPTSTTQTPTTEAPNPPVDDPNATLAAEYEAYKNMSSSEQKAWRENKFKDKNGKFDSNAFFAWHKEALAAYQAANPPTPIPPDGNIDLS